MQYAPALARLFAGDGFVLSSGSEMVRGRDAIHCHYKHAGGPLFLRPVAYARQGKIGYIICGFTDQKGGADRGKFTLTLRQDAAGRGLIVSDMDNGNRPPQPPR